MPDGRLSSVGFAGGASSLTVYPFVFALALARYAAGRCGLSGVRALCHPPKLCFHWGAYRLTPRLLYEQTAGLICLPLLSSLVLVSWSTASFSSFLF